MINRVKMGGPAGGPNKELGRGGKGRDGNGVQSFDGRSNLQSGENNGQPVDPGPGAGRVSVEDA